MMYKVEQIGSLLRPEWLKEARIRFDAGEISAAEFKSIEDRAVREAVAVQEAAGMDVVTDGEQRRSMFFSWFFDALSGFDLTASSNFPGLEWRGLNGAAQSTNAKTPVVPVVTRKLARKKAVSVEEFTFLRAITDRPKKITLPSPLLAWSFWSSSHSAAAYPDIFDLFHDVARLLREEIEELRALGCEYVQIDAPELAILIDPSLREGVKAQTGIDTERLLKEGIACINEVVDGLEGIKTCLHICRGNNAGQFYAEGGYESIAKALFKGARSFDLYSLEYDDPRSGNFEPLALVPKGKGVILGLISTKRPDIEAKDLLKARIDEATRFIPLERIGISPQCGFASTWEGNPLTTADQAKKLQLVREVAEEVLQAPSSESSPD